MIERIPTNVFTNTSLVAPNRVFRTAVVPHTMTFYTTTATECQCPTDDGARFLQSTPCQNIVIKPWSCR